MSEFKDLEIGKVFVLGEKKLIVAEGKLNSCDGCAFEHVDAFCGDLESEGYIPNCMRGDTAVVFKKVED